ncbi:MAG: Calcineurin-like phosphoesterase superfamily domain containing protein [Anaerosporomusa subterranea]|jgi:predicted MPP superfamily phosphohydrolase|nr:Calcineurin-like phosphoesterase superfamily domain containing protein [Anaerosporomusa subterranea]
MRTQGWYLFQVVTVAFLLSINYLADRLLRRLYSRYAGKPRILFWLLALLSVLVYALARTAVFREVGAGSILKYFMYGMVIWDIAIAGLLFSWPLCWIASRFVRREEQDPGRRAFIGQALGLGAAVSLSGAIGGVIAAESSVVVRRKTLSFTNLPPSLSGLRVVQISDSHLGLFFSLNRWEEILRLAQNEQPDLLLLTGDIVDDLELLTPALDKLASTRPSIPCGIFACLGNHEYFRNVSIVRRAFASAGVPLLSNENRRLVKGNGEFYLLAADYPLTRSPGEREALCQEYAKLAASGVPKQDFAIFMAHHPDFINEGFRRNIPLTVAGHTHGAQFGWGERSLFEGAFSYTRGLYQQGPSYGFVSSGVGHWLPFRLNCPPEIVSFTLMRTTVE